MFLHWTLKKRWGKQSVLFLPQTKADPPVMLLLLKDLSNWGFLTEVAALSVWLTPWSIIEETLPLVLSTGNQVPGEAVLPYPSLPEWLETLSKLPVSPLQLDHNGSQFFCVPSSKALMVNLEFPVLLSVRGSRKDHPPQLQCRTHYLQLKNNEFWPTELTETLAASQNPTWKLIFFLDREGWQSDCNLGCALSKTPQHLRKLVSFLLFGGIIYFIPCTGTWLLSCHLTPKKLDLLGRSLDVTFV